MIDHRGPIALGNFEILDVSAKWAGEVRIYPGINHSITQRGCHEIPADGHKTINFFVGNTFLDIGPVLYFETEALNHYHVCPFGTKRFI
jgi:hypothetical protein